MAETISWLFINGVSESHIYRLLNVERPSAEMDPLHVEIRMSHPLAHLSDEILFLYSGANLDAIH